MSFQDGFVSGFENPQPEPGVRLGLWFPDAAWSGDAFDPPLLGLGGSGTFRVVVPLGVVDSWVGAFAGEGAGDQSISMSWRNGFDLRCGFGNNPFAGCKVDFSGLSMQSQPGVIIRFLAGMLIIPLSSHHLR